MNLRSRPSPQESIPDESDNKMNSDFIVSDTVLDNVYITQARESAPSLVNIISNASLPRRIVNINDYELTYRYDYSDTHMHAYLTGKANVNVHEEYRYITIKAPIYLKDIEDLAISIYTINKDLRTAFNYYCQDNSILEISEAREVN